MNELHIQIIALALTILVEFFIVLLVLKEYKWNTILLYVILINLVSFPLAVNFYSFQVLTFFEIELSVFVLEYFLLGVLIQERYFRVGMTILFANFVTAVLSFLFI